MNTQFEGRVFTRKEHFQQLPREMQTETRELEKYLIAHKANLFENHRPNLINSVFGIKGNDLLETTMRYLNKMGAPAAKPVGIVEKIKEKVDPNYHSEVRPAEIHDHSAHQQPTEMMAHGAVGGHGKPVHMEATQLIQALIMDGFITANKVKDHSKQSKLQKELFDENEIYIPLSKVITNQNETTVWDAVDGAIYAKFMKRKVGVLEAMVSGKDVYVVVNEKRKGVYLFNTDISRDPIREILSSTASYVSMDNSSFTYGIKVWQENGNDEYELFDVETQQQQNEFIGALTTIGFQHGENRHGVGHQKTTAGQQKVDHNVGHHRATTEQQMAGHNVARHEVPTEQHGHNVGHIGSTTEHQVGGYNGVDYPQKTVGVNQGHQGGYTEIPMATEIPTAHQNMGQFDTNMQPMGGQGAGYQGTAINPPTEGRYPSTEGKIPNNGRGIPFQ
jgi:hypothetical protein